MIPCYHLFSSLPHSRNLNEYLLVLYHPVTHSAFFPHRACRFSEHFSRINTLRCNRRSCQNLSTWVQLCHSKAIFNRFLPFPLSIWKFLCAHPYGILSFSSCLSIKNILYRLQTFFRIATKNPIIRKNKCQIIS